ncbi:MAG: hypothetical protein V4528_06585 [Pseudomonadota bacterium]
MLKYKTATLIIAFTSAAILSDAAEATLISAAGYATTSVPTRSINNNLSIPIGGTVAGTNDVSMTWDGTVFTSSSDYTGPGSASNMTLSSPSRFFSEFWTAHDVQVFRPGTYIFDTALGGGVPEFGNQVLTIGSGELGAHMLIDWNGIYNMDVSVLWKPNGVFGNNVNQQGLTGTAVWDAVSVDGSGDGIPGIPIANGGPFTDLHINFNLNGIRPLPEPPIVWLLGSGLMGLIAMTRRMRK